MTYGYIQFTKNVYQQDKYFINPLTAISANVNPSRGGSRNFGKWGPVRGQSPEPNAEGASAGGESGGPPPENFEKLDSIFCNLAYIVGIKIASDIVQNWAFVEQKNSSGHGFDSHTRIQPHTSKNSSDFSHYKIQIQFQNVFSDIICKNNYM